MRGPPPRRQGQWASSSGSLEPACLGWTPAVWVASTPGRTAAGGRHFPPKAADGSHAPPQDRWPPDTFWAVGETPTDRKKNRRVTEKDLGMARWGHRKGRRPTS